jgi:hypothetical protein
MKEAIRARAYWNLRRKCWSIMVKRKVIGYASTILMRDVTFKVLEKSRQRIISSKRKNVHAFAEGIIIEQESEKPYSLTKMITYNPYRFGYFFDKHSLEKVESNKLIYLGNKILFGSNEKSNILKQSV